MGYDLPKYSLAQLIWRFGKFVQVFSLSTLLRFQNVNFPIRWKNQNSNLNGIIELFVTLVAVGSDAVIANGRVEGSRVTAETTGETGLLVDGQHVTRAVASAM